MKEQINTMVDMQTPKLFCQAWSNPLELCKGVEEFFTAIEGHVSYMLALGVCYQYTVHFNTYAFG